MPPLTNRMNSYDDLVEKTAASSADFNSRLKRIREIEIRQQEISELQKHIGTYGKTRERYKEYLASGRDVDFYETFRADIALHQAAKKHFNESGYGKNKKLPSINSLKQEWAALESERKSLYRDYRELKENRTELIIARDNIERFLGINRIEPERVAERTQ